MLSFLATKLKKKARKYPIRRDMYGKSARQCAFDYFDVGKKPAEVSSLVGISPRTARRYFADWKKLPKNLELRYHTAKTMLKSNNQFSDKVVQTIASSLGMSEEEAIMRLEKPWGLKQLLTGKWPNYRRERMQSRQEARLVAALKLVVLVEHSGLTPKEVEALFDKLINEVPRGKAG